MASSNPAEGETVQASALDEVGPAVAAIADRKQRVAEIYGDEYAFVRRSLRHLGVFETEIRDAVQSVFLVVVRKLDTFEGRSTLRTWLFGICLRVAKAIKRKRARVEPLDRTPHTAAGLDEAVAAREAVEIVASLLERLDDDQRTVFVLVELEGMRVTEVATSLDVKLNTVYSRLRIARQKFERALARHRQRQRRTSDGPAER